MTEEKTTDGAKGAGEPSMEEILASIRRIIAEDSDKAADREPPPRQAGWAPVLDLTEMVNADGSVTSLKPPAEAPAPEMPRSEMPRSEMPGSVMPGSVMPDAAAPLTGPPDPETPLPEAFQPETDNHHMPPQPDFGAARPSPPPEAGRPGTLFSELIAQKTKAAFAQVEEASRPPEPPLPPVPAPDGRSVDQFLADLLEPMLRDWLDRNLPGIVERLVAEELARISNRARG